MDSGKKYYKHCSYELRGNYSSNFKCYKRARGESLSSDITDTETETKTYHVWEIETVLKRVSFN